MQTHTENPNQPYSSLFLKDLDSVGVATAGTGLQAGWSLLDLSFPTGPLVELVANLGKLDGVPFHHIWLICGPALQTQQVFPRCYNPPEPSLPVPAHRSKAMFLVSR